jgi:hypothetical protein
VLGELQDSHADFFIGDTVCALDPAKKPKARAEAFGQGVLLFPGVEAR